jgi:type IV pilus assembly protein PilM
MSTYGLDFGSTYLKLAEVDGDKLVHTLVTPNPIGKIIFETEQETNQIVESLKKTFSERKVNPNKVRVTISEGVCYSRVISMPVLSQAELSNAIKYEAEQYIPVSLSEVELSYEVITKGNQKGGDDKMSVLLVAASTKVLSNVVNVLSKLGIEPEIMEPESISTARAAILQKEQTDNTMLLTLGAVTSSITIFQGQNIVFTHRIDTGSAAVTRAIATTLSLPIPQAEEYKRSYGIKADILEGKLYQAVLPLANNLVSEVKKAFSFIVTTNLNTKPTRLMLSGGGSLLPGLVQFLSQNTGLEVTTANLNYLKKNTKETPLPDQVTIASVGAALR